MIINEGSSDIDMLKAASEVAKAKLTGADFKIIKNLGIWDRLLKICQSTTPVPCPYNLSHLTFLVCGPCRSYTRQVQQQ